jgi:hypothetical protein
MGERKEVKTYVFRVGLNNPEKEEFTGLIVPTRDPEGIAKRMATQDGAYFRSDKSEWVWYHSPRSISYVRFCEEIETPEKKKKTFPWMKPK